MEPPASPIEVLLLPGILFFIAAIIYGVAYMRAAEGESMPKFRWSAAVLLFVVLILGVLYEWRMFNPTDGFMYRDVLDKKTLFAHHGTVVLALLGFGAIFFVERLFKNRSKARAIF